MSDKRQERTLSSLSSKLLRLLEPLRRSEDGAAVYHYIEQSLRERDQAQQQVEQSYADLVHLLLAAFAHLLPPGSPLLVKLRLLQMRLEPPLAAKDLTQLHEALQAALTRNALAEVYTTQETIESAMAPLLACFSLSEGAVASQKPPMPAATVIPKHHPRAASTPIVPTPPAATTEQFSAEPERRVDMSYRRHLDEKRQGILKIHQALTKQVDMTIERNNNFANFLEAQLEKLRQQDERQDIEAVRQSIIDETGELLEAHKTLAEELTDTCNDLRAIEADSQQLSDEMTRVHLLSLTDDLTGLANRRAFLRRMQDEIGRVQRYGSPLSLAVIDLDGFKAVNDQYGHAAGDAVLKTYASEVLTIFRHHDMVARYGGEEFAVLLPNTTGEGTMRALRKVQKRSTEATFEHDGKALSLPTFSAGITLYRAGESAEDFMQRADHALYRAKRLGRNRIESAEQEQSQSGHSSMG